MGTIPDTHINYDLEKHEMRRFRTPERNIMPDTGIDLNDPDVKYEMDLGKDPGSLNDAMQRNLNLGNVLAEFHAISVLCKKITFML